MLITSKIFFALYLCLLFCVGTAPANQGMEQEGEKQLLYLSNGIVQIGVDSRSGGSIRHFSLQQDGKNLLNHYDRGRFVQQSYYGDEDGSKWGSNDWRWNPVQGGDYKGKPAEVEEISVKDGELYISSIPVHWASGEDMDSCRMEEWIRLEKDEAHIRFRFTYRGKKAHEARHQELPAVFIIGELPHLHFYSGSDAWTGDKLTKMTPGKKNEYYTLTEHWAAFTDDKGHGVGMYFPGTNEITTYYVKNPDPKTWGDGPEDPSCAYFSPIQTLAMTPGLVLEYEVVLKAGNLEEMRNAFKKMDSEKSVKPVELSKLDS